MASKYGPIKAVIPNRASHDFNNLVLGRSTRYSAAKITKCPARALCKPIRQSIGGAKVKRMAPSSRKDIRCVIKPNNSQEKIACMTQHSNAQIPKY